MLKKYFSNAFIVICFICYLFLTGLIFYFSLADATTSTSQSNSVWEIFARLFGWGEDFKVFVRKFIGHFLMFLTLALFATIVYYKFSILFFEKHAFAFSMILTLLVGFLTASVAEIFQLEVFTVGRHASFKDVLINFSGYALGYYACLGFNILVKTIIYRKRAKQS